MKLNDQVRLYHVRNEVDAGTYAQLKDEPRFQDSLRSNAARSLAEAILREAGESTVTEPPMTGDYDDWGKRTVYEWTAQVVMPGPAHEYFKAQQAAVRASAYNDGLQHAIDQIEDAYNIWRGVAPQAAFMLKALLGDLREDYRRRRQIEPADPGELKLT